jgi:S1-C subfamily serine protease
LENKSKFKTKKGDIILEINGKQISYSDEIQAIVASLKNEILTIKYLSILRNFQEMTDSNEKSTKNGLRAKKVKQFYQVVRAFLCFVLV